jgi:hypothetical protein|tara:strand:- start:27 stop:308 length:282 start_codon:yes stop_codon:yes gene_type:complete
MNKYVNGVLVAMTDEEVAQIIAEQPTDAEVTARKWVAVRLERNAKLVATDWVVTKATETGVAVSDDWKTYRQALRDVPTQSDPDNITWPTEPS